jgi:hypothetical protein
MAGVARDTSSVAVLSAASDHAHPGTPVAGPVSLRHSGSQAVCQRPGRMPAASPALPAPASNRQFYAWGQPAASASSCAAAWSADCPVPTARPSKYAVSGAAGRST